MTNQRSAGIRVLVTGGAGRLGRSVVAALAQHGHEPVSVDMATLSTGAACESFPADLTQAGEAYAAVARYRPDAIVHLAAVAVPFSMPEGRIHATNTALAFNTMQAAVDLGVDRVITASSPTVIGYGNPAGWRPEYLPLDEDHPLRPWNAYALSKLSVESTMRMFAAQCGTKVRFAAFRPCFVVSPEDWEGAPTQDGRTIRDRLAEPALAATSLFNYIDARDAADLVVALLEARSEIPNAEVFFASAGDALAQEPLQDLLPQYQPATAPYVTRLSGHAPAFSSHKAEQCLGWRPTRSWRTELR